MNFWLSTILLTKTVLKYLRINNQLSLPSLLVQLVSIGINCSGRQAFIRYNYLTSNIALRITSNFFVQTFISFSRFKNLAPHLFYNNVKKWSIALPTNWTTKTKSHQHPISMKLQTCEITKGLLVVLLITQDQPHQSFTQVRQWFVIYATLHCSKQWSFP